MISTDLTKKASLKKNKPVLFFLLMVFLFGSCQSSAVFEENKAIEESIWHQDKEVYFDVPITDTLSLHRIFINVRHKGGYAYSNLFLFVKTVYPADIIVQDTVEYYLATPQGEWLGSGIGDIKYNSQLYKKGVRFPQKGIYRVFVSQGMRELQLKDICDIGIRIEK